MLANLTVWVIKTWGGQCLDGLDRKASVYVVKTEEGQCQDNRDKSASAWVVKTGWEGLNV